jgi:hypothetical protein
MNYLEYQVNYCQDIVIIIYAIYLWIIAVISYQLDYFDLWICRYEGTEIERA